MRVFVALLALSAVACAAHAPQDRSLRLVPPLTDAERTEVFRLGHPIENAISADAFEAHDFTAADGTLVRYRLLRPAVGAPERRYPLLVIFHPSGALGTDNRAQIDTLPKTFAAPEMRRRYPAFVAVPQFAARAASYTKGPDGLAQSHPTAALTAALELVDSLRKDPAVDSQRIYAIGFSMGGSAVWNAIVLRPGLFRAAIAVAGIPNREALEVLGTTRLLVIHGDADSANSFEPAWRVYQENPQRMEFWRLQATGHVFPYQFIVRPVLAEWLWR